MTLSTQELQDMAHIRINLEDGKPPVEFNLAEADADRFQAFMASVQQVKEDAARPPVAYIVPHFLERIKESLVVSQYVRVRNVATPGYLPLFEKPPVNPELQVVVAALKEACELLEGWIAWKCPAKHRQEHLDTLARLRSAGGF